MMIDQYPPIPFVFGVIYLPAVILLLNTDYS